MGTADGVPGVSGGTVALITGIYDRLVAAVSAVDPSLARRLLADLGRGPDALVETLREADVPFLLTLGAGLVTAVLIVVPSVNTALTTAPAITFGAFFGLIAASVWVLRDAVAVDETRGLVAFLAAVAIAGVASGSARAALSGSLPATFLAGALAVSAMLLPGISGSLILVIIGQYERMSGALKELLTALSTVATGGSAPELGPLVVTVAVFVAGGVVGLLSVARVVRAALARDRRTTTTFLVGLVVGALRAPVAGTTTALAEAGRSWTPTVVGAFLVAAAAGAVVVLALDRLAGDVDI
ncbi:DUF368 domain-containing protein [Halobaculum sp. MBLA0147]|uniref:DUF368 domain-containing protein n=1 Tax=Halobaculum sp. MBLA0147 TaxID=3079934 RepID=UPI0035269373